MKNALIFVMVVVIAVTTANEVRRNVSASIQRCLAAANLDPAMLRNIASLRNLNLNQISTIINCLINELGVLTRNRIDMNLILGLLRMDRNRSQAIIAFLNNCKAQAERFDRPTQVARAFAECIARSVKLIQ